MSLPAKTRDHCARPTWANVMLLDKRGSIVATQSTAFHGLPRVGDYLDTLDHAGPVVRVRWARATGGEFKATVVVEVDE